MAKPLLQSIRRQSVTRRPLWIMRQAVEVCMDASASAGGCHALDPHYVQLAAAGSDTAGGRARTLVHAGLHAGLSDEALRWTR